MDIGRGLRFPLDDQQWVSKVLIGTLVSFVPILNIAAVGYMLDVTRNVAGGRDTPLPEWDNLGDKFVRGLIGTVIQLLWALPIVLLACPMMFIAIASSAWSPNGEPTAAAGIAIGCLGLLAAALGVALTPFIYAAMSRYAVNNNFSEPMPGPVLRQLRGNWGPWITIVLVLVAAGLVIGVLTICTFGIGLIPFVFIFQLIQGHWMGQAFRQTAGSQAFPPHMV